MTAAESEALCQLVRERAWAGRHLEIGTAAAGTLCGLLKAAAHSPPFVVVDPMTYFPNQRQAVERNIAQHGLSVARVDIREMLSWRAYQQARRTGERFDFVLVDGAHKCRYVVQDLHWTNLLNAGGVLALHDYHPSTRGVMLAADHFLARNPNYRRLGLIDRLLLVEKTAADGPGGVQLMSGIFAALIQVGLQWRASLRKRLKPSSTGQP